MACREYADRPRICHRRFMELHGVTVTQGPESHTLVIPADCEWHIG